MNRMEAPEGFSGSGAHDFGSPLPLPKVNEQQVSRLELFALTTCVAFGIGVVRRKTFRSTSLIGEYYV